MAAGVARIIEICFVARPLVATDPQAGPDESARMVTSPFQHLPPFVSRNKNLAFSANADRPCADLASNSSGVRTRIYPQATVAD